MPSRGRLGARRRHRDAEQRVGAEPALGRRAVERDHRLVERRADRVRGRRSAFAISPLTLATAFRTPLPPYRALSPSRSSSASRSPVDAPDGTAARPSAPPSSVTSTSTVGLPRESRISRPCTRVIFTTLLTSDCVLLSPPPVDRPPPRTAALRRSSGPMSGSSSVVTTTTPESVTVWRRRSSSRL